MTTYSPRIPKEHNIADRGSDFWNNCVYVESEKEYQCIVEQVVYPDTQDRRYYDGLEDLKSVKIFKKWWSNILYCKHDDALISKQIVENTKEKVETQLNRMRENPPKYIKK